MAEHGEPDERTLLVETLESVRRIERKCAGCRARLDAHDDTMRQQARALAQIEETLDGPAGNGARPGLRTTVALHKTRLGEIERRVTRYVLAAGAVIGAIGSWLLGLLGSWISAA